jgi:hypothetical protein
MEMDEKQTEEKSGGSRRMRGGYGRIWTGLFLLAIGAVLLLDQMGFPFPYWFFTWQMLLIAIGLFLGFRHNFHGGGWLIMILIGSFFMVQDNFPGIAFHRFIGPIALICVALLILLRPQRRWGDHGWKTGPWAKRGSCGDAPWAKGMPENKEQWKDWKREWKWHRRYETGQTTYSSSDFLDATCIFGGVHRKVVTKNFRGGDVTTFMGGSEIDLSQADINGIVVLDVTQVMGATKIFVPAHWEVRSEVSALFAGFEDKRQQPVAVNPDKVLILKGASFFGGIELRNF